MKRLMTLLTLALLGCSGNIPVGTNPDPVTITANVSMAGAPVDGLKLNFQAIGDGLPAVMDIKNGTATGPVTPGNYTWFVSGSEKDLADRKIPDQYREGSMDRKLDVTGTATIDVKLD
ncbi:hypothetical protein LBMAG46_33180 [Planctomycetia bacterium]|nr:hypothetical protein LBMAG46_33180 [Planctomycetia bacterium]